MIFKYSYDPVKIINFEPVFINNNIAYIIDKENNISYDLSKGKIYFATSNYFVCKKFMNNVIIYIVPIKYFGRIFQEVKLE